MSNRLITKLAPAYKVEIFIAGDIVKAEEICQEFCNNVGLCVTVDQTNYIFTGGSERGVKVGLINYARFPKDSSKIWEMAVNLAFALKKGLGQGFFTVQDDVRSCFCSDRDEDQ